MPSEESLDKKTYYASPTNMFWDFIYRILLSKYPPFKPFDHQIPREERYQLLLDNYIGLWDVIRDCLRTDSRDSRIQDETLNDIAAFVNQNNFTMVIFNGKKSYTFLRDTGQLKEFNKSIKVLGSTSSSNRNNTFQTFIVWQETIAQALQDICKV